jgi:hypothetical protein
MLKRSPEAKALVFFTPYRPWLLPNDLAFFDLIKEAGFDVDKFFEHTMEKVMFEEDPGVSCIILPKLYGSMYADRKTRTSSFAARCSDTALCGQKINCLEA